MCVPGVPAALSAQRKTPPKRGFSLGSWDGSGESERLQTGFLSYGSQSANHAMVLGGLVLKSGRRYLYAMLLRPEYLSQ